MPAFANIVPRAAWSGFLLLGVALVRDAVAVSYAPCRAKACAFDVGAAVHGTIGCWVAACKHGMSCVWMDGHSSRGSTLTSRSQAGIGVAVIVICK